MCLAERIVRASTALRIENARNEQVFLGITFAFIKSWPVCEAVLGKTHQVVEGHHERQTNLVPH